MCIGSGRDLLARRSWGHLATQDGFWRVTRDPAAEGALLHVSCHAHMDPLEPMSSGLLLADVAKVDAAEVARGSLPFDEVVLSGCSTGWRPTRVGGVELAGDDTVGLPAAFLEAWVRSVLVSVPPAADLATF